MNTVQFNSLPKPKQAVLVAKDVIAQIKAKKYKAKKQSYVKFDSASTDKLLDAEKTTELHTLLPKLNCHVCARGAMFMSHIKYADKFQVKDLRIQDNYWSGHTPSVTSKDILKRELPFDKLEQYMIEAAFELSDINEQLETLLVPSREQYLYRGRHQLKSEAKEQLRYSAVLLVNACIKFGRRYKNIDNRLVAIMKNVVKNKGSFIPYDK